MKEKEIKNISASAKDRLRSISITTGNDYQSILRMYMQERFLFRLSKSIYSANLILKGALLFVAHNISRTRPTKDIDFHGASISGDKDEIIKIISEIISIEFEDGLRFDSVEAEVIIENGDYKGVRVKFYAYLENTRERMQLDIGFGDVITAGPVEIEYPTLLNYPSPNLLVYSIETAVAEKFEAIVSLNLLTSRMKDFYDIIFFTDSEKINEGNLRDAIIATFRNRGTDLKDRKIIYKEEFKNDEEKQRLWNAFLTRSRLESKNTFSEVVNNIEEFVEKVLKID